MSDGQSTISTAAQALCQQAQQMIQNGQFAQAIQSLENVAELEQHADAHYLQAVAHRKLNQRNKALTALKRVSELNPKFARAYQEIGHVHMAARSPDKARKGYEAAVAINPALIASWRALVELYKLNQDEQSCAQAQHQLAQLEQLPRELQAVKSFLNEDKIELADQVCRQYLQQHKQDIEGMRLLAEIASRMRIIDDAEFILESAVSFNPGHIGARVDYVTILLKRQRFEKAQEIASALAAEFPDNQQFAGLLGATELGLGNTDKAIETFTTLAKSKFNLQHTLLSLGHAHKTAGNFSEAISNYQALYDFKPDYGDAFWSLANTKTYHFSEQEIAHMQDFAMRDEVSTEDRIHLNFALGKAFEDQQNFDTAFDYYRRGNRMHKEAIDYQLPAIEHRIERQKRYCTLDFFKQKTAVGYEAPDPIFIVGLPRAGSTLLEQILASHSSVDGTMELPNILALSRRLRGRAPSGPDTEPQYPRILTELTDDYFEGFGKQYIDDTRVFREGAPHFIDKMPNNFVHIGLIKLILPNAKIIDARRHPMSCCFSGFKQLFAEGQEFTYGLQDIGHYYKCYVDMMDHWDEVLPGFVLRVQHEDVVNDLESQVHRMLDFCGLPFEQACIEFHKTSRNVRTPSSEQVRQPIYTSGLEHWRNFASHLSPLTDALGEDVLSRYPILPTVVESVDD